MQLFICSFLACLELWLVVSDCELGGLEELGYWLDGALLGDGADCDGEVCAMAIPAAPMAIKAIAVDIRFIPISPLDQSNAEHKELRVPKGPANHCPWRQSRTTTGGPGPAEPCLRTAGTS